MVDRGQRLASGPKQGLDGLRVCLGFIIFPDRVARCLEKGRETPENEEMGVSGHTVFSLSVYLEPGKGEVDCV